MKLKNQHESAVLNSFAEYNIRNGHEFAILERPDPPDAIVAIDGKKNWIEITDAFLNKDLAESITSFAHSKKDHKPVPKDKRFVVEPDEQFSQKIAEVIEKKYALPTLKIPYQELGSGILLVGMITPFNNSYNLAIEERAKVLEIVNNNQPLFKQIYFYSPWEKEFIGIIK